jgi:hypothetical protein
MNLTRLIVPADACQGGAIAPFQGAEHFGSPGHEVVNRSLPRTCIALDAAGIRGSFDLAAVPSRGRALFRFRGMWDGFRDVPLGLQNATRILRTSGHFAVRVNDTAIFDGEVAFCDCRRWRFWPSIDLPLPLSALRPGANTFEIVNRSAPFRVLSDHPDCTPERVANTRYQVSDVQVLLLEDAPPVPPAPLPPGTFLGHLLPWHPSTDVVGGSLEHILELFVRERQGNLVALLMNPGKSSVDLDLDRVDTAAIIRAGLFVALRYYGENRNATIEEGAYIRKLRSFTRRLGDHFIGFGPHEQHGEMERLLRDAAPDADIARYSRTYVESFRRRVQNIRAIRADVPVWDTDPSFYSRYHLQAGADMPGIECAVHHVSLEIASARGAARAYGCPAWVAINSFECQAYGGLTMLDGEALAEPDFEGRRERLWEAIQRLLYLGGARILYSESGPFEHRVTRQQEFDDPHLGRLRAAQTDLADFVRDHALAGPPLASVAYLQGRHDVYKGNRFAAPIVRASGGGALSWSLLSVCYPDVPFLQWEEGPLAETVDRDDKLAILSDTPFGQADVLPIEAPGTVWQAYRALILTGWNTLDDETSRKMLAYAEAGGCLVVLLPQFTGASDIADPVASVATEALLRVCGVVLNGGGEAQTGAWHCPPSGLRGRLDPVCSAMGDIPAIPLADLAVASASAEVVIAERNHNRPVMIRHAVGLGQVLLFNLARYPGSTRAYAPLRPVLRAVLESLALPVTVVRGRHVNFFRYPAAPGQRGDRLHLVNTDWMASGEISEIVLRIGGRETPVAVARNAITVLDLPPDLP